MVTLSTSVLPIKYFLCFCVRLSPYGWAIATKARSILAFAELCRSYSDLQVRGSVLRHCKLRVAFTEVQFTVKSKRNSLGFPVLGLLLDKDGLYW